MEGSGHQHAGDTIPHQDETEEVVDKQLERTSDHAAIADLAAASVGYVQAEATATRNKVNEILDVLRDAGLIPT